MGHVMTTDEVSQRLGLSPGRVRALLESGIIRGGKLGRAWAVSQEDFQEYADRRPVEGRPWSVDSVWDVLMLASGWERDLTPLARSRAAQRLRGGILNLVPRLHPRAQRVRTHASQSNLPVLRAHPAIVLSGVSASTEVIALREVEGYVRKSGLGQLSADALVMPEISDEPNVLLRVIDDASWPFREETQEAPPAAVAVDLLDNDDETRRANAAGLNLIAALRRRGNPV